MIIDINTRLAQRREDEKAKKEGLSMNKAIVSCVDCSTEREINVQDVFQVKRCPECQVKYRRKLDGLRRRAKKAKSATVWIDDQTEVIIGRSGDVYRFTAYNPSDYGKPIWDITIVDGADYTINSGDRSHVRQAYEALRWFQDGRWTPELR